MYKRLCAYTDHIDQATTPERLAAMTAQERDALTKELLTQIGFFQHERLIHFLVTMLFAVCAIMVLLAMSYFKTIAMLVLFVMLLVLLVPYIGHYYHLENGTQKLYTYYDRLIGWSFGDDVSGEKSGS